MFLMMTMLVISSCGQKVLTETKECTARGYDSVAYSCKNLMLPLLPTDTTEILNFRVNPLFTNFESDEREKALEALDLIMEVIRSEEFRDEVFLHQYEGQNTFADNGGLSNEQVYAAILQGAERLFPRRNFTMDLILVLYEEDSNIMGYTLATSTNVWLNQKYYRSGTPAEIAGTLMHEWLHKLGFAHAVEYSERRQRSVPYAVGNIVRRMARGLGN